MRFRRLQSRILFFVLGLFAVIQGVTFLAVTAANWRSANQQIESDLIVSGRVFDRFSQARIDQFVVGSRLLSGDFAFKEAYANGDRETLLSAVANLQQNRIDADVMMLADADDYSVIIDTLHPTIFDLEYPFPELIESAEESGEPSSSLGMIDDRLYRLVVVPLLAPEPVAWITVGFLIDDVLAADLRDLTLTDVAFLQREPQGNYTVLASTLPASLREALAKHVTTQQPGSRQRFSWSQETERFVALAITVGEQLMVVLQRSLEQALTPFERLYRILVALTLFVLALSIVGAVLIARSVTRPVTILVEGTRHIEQGDYQHQIVVSQNDEIGQLADAFNQMSRGLTAFQRYLPIDLVRTLIAKGIEARPQTRVATILFVDIEAFTNVAEQLSPELTVTMLNEYFSAVTRPIEKYRGVITQFQGDAILTVFNVPTDDAEHGLHAVRAALEINEVVKQQTFAGITLNIRIGINTGEVVAGSVGSENRLNYTVHGDAVNLAARLETLNKEYGTRILATQETIDILGPDIQHQRIGEIRIRGKQESVTVYKLA
ncbi:MAG: HAMP domain-containing protein [Gammaproteobacteria bacterium]|nr:HAMP domain-containing protein [Gammaproteobacteria bacterium]